MEWKQEMWKLFQSTTLGEVLLALLAMIALSAVQTSAQTIIHNAFLFIDTSDNASCNQLHWLIRSPYLSVIASNDLSLRRWYGCFLPFRIQDPTIMNSLVETGCPLEIVLAGWKKRRPGANKIPTRGIWVGFGEKNERGQHNHLDRRMREMNQMKNVFLLSCS